MSLYPHPTRQHWHKSVRNRIADHKRRARSKGKPVDFSPTAWEAAMAYFGDACAYCGAPETDFEYGLTIDHFLPLENSTTGGTTATNIVPSCTRCNYRKSARNPYAWLMEEFGEARGLQIADAIERYFDTIDGKVEEK